jgi:hypothetical protein
MAAMTTTMSTLRLSVKAPVASKSAKVRHTRRGCIRFIDGFLKEARRRNHSDDCKLSSSSPHLGCVRRALQGSARVLRALRALHPPRRRRHVGHHRRHHREDEDPHRKCCCSGRWDATRFPGMREVACDRNLRLWGLGRRGFGFAPGNTQAKTRGGLQGVELGGFGAGMQPSRGRRALALAPPVDLGLHVEASEGDVSRFGFLPNPGTLNQKVEGKFVGHWMAWWG